jgi:uroporphyrinogen decarboxylase
MLHLHGDDVTFDLMLSYPANMLNWHDRHSDLDLCEAKSRFDGVLVGGLDEEETLHQGPIEAIRNAVQDAIVQTSGRRLMIGPGCVTPIATPGSHYRAVIDAVTEMQLYGRLLVAESL